MSILFHKKQESKKNGRSIDRPFFCNKKPCWLLSKTRVGTARVTPLACCQDYYMRFYSKSQYFFTKNKKIKKTGGQSTVRFLCQFLECCRDEEIYAEQQGYDYRDNGNLPFGFVLFRYRIFDQRNHVFDGRH